MSGDNIVSKRWWECLNTELKVVSMYSLVEARSQYGDRSAWSTGKVTGEAWDCCELDMVEGCL